jgi:hypothetical protein
MKENKAVITGADDVEKKHWMERFDKDLVAAKSI